MGQTETKAAQYPITPSSFLSLYDFDPTRHQNPAEASAESPPASPNLPTTTSSSSSSSSSTQHHVEDTPRDESSNTYTTLTSPKDDGGRGGGALKTQQAIKRGTGELVGGFNKLGANLISTAKGAVPYTSHSVSAGFKKAATAVEDAIVTVKAGIVKNEEEPELEALAKMALFFPLIRSSVPISDLAKGLPVQKTTISYLDPRSILVSLADYQRFLIVTTKMVAARQGELSNKVKDFEMSSGRKTVFTLAMKVTDMRHFNTQFSEVARFHSNMEKTKQSINNILGMFEKLNSILPAGEQLETFSDFAASNPTLSSSHSSQKFSSPSSHSSHSSINYASLNLPASQSSGSFKNFNIPSSSPNSSGKFPSLTPTPSPHSSMKFSTLSTTPTSNATNPDLVADPKTTDSDTTNQDPTNSNLTSTTTTHDVSVEN